MILTHQSNDQATDSGIEPTTSLQAEAAALRLLVDQMRERERRLMMLLKATAPERIEHDLRNVLNELVLLRTLFDPKSPD
jgi:hypothetical protein